MFLHPWQRHADVHDRPLAKQTQYFFKHPLVQLHDMPPLGENRASAITAHGRPRGLQGSTGSMSKRSSHFLSRKLGRVSVATDILR